MWLDQLQDRYLTSLDILVPDALNVRRRALVALEHGVLSRSNETIVITCKAFENGDVTSCVPL